MLATPRVFPRLITHQIRGHRKEPRAFTLDRTVAECAQKRLLRHFLRPIPITQSSRQIAHERRMIGSKEIIGVGHSFTKASVQYEVARSKSSHSPPAQPR